MLDEFVSFLNNNSGVTSVLSSCVVGFLIPYYFRKKERKQYDLSITENVFVRTRPRMDDPIELSNHLSIGPTVRTDKRIWICNRSASLLHNVVALTVDEKISDVNLKKLNFREHIKYGGAIKIVDKTTIYGQKYAFTKSEISDPNNIVILFFEDDRGSFWIYNDGTFIKLKKSVDINKRYTLHLNEMSTAESDGMYVNK